MQRKKFIKLTGATGVFTMFGGTAWLLQSCNGQNNMEMSANGIKIIEGDFVTALPAPPLFDLKNTPAFEGKPSISEGIMRPCQCILVACCNELVN